MLRSHTLLLAASVAMLALGGCKKQDVPDVEASASGPGDPLASAQSAAPKAVGEKATVVSAQADGNMQTLRKGSNGFTCMPDNPVTPGPDPMCMDGNAMKWAMAWMKHETPPAETPGFIYMLAGGTDASNTDPYAQTPSEGEDWVRTGPHTMIVGSAKALDGYPAGARPDTSQPYVMWANTPYAHLMIPVT